MKMPVKGNKYRATCLPPTRPKVKQVTIAPLNNINTSAQLKRDIIQIPKKRPAARNIKKAVTE